MYFSLFSTVFVTPYYSTEVPAFAVCLSSAVGLPTHTRMKAHLIQFQRTHGTTRGTYNQEGNWLHSEVPLPRLRPRARKSIYPEVPSPGKLPSKDCRYLKTTDTKLRHSLQAT